MVPLMDDGDSALTMLLERLRWPVKMVRWKAAKALRSLLIDLKTRPRTLFALLDWLSKRELESEVLSGLSVLAVSPRDVRPPFDVLAASINAPSLGANFLLHEMYRRTMASWLHGNSGDAPKDFAVESFFEDHRTAHVPPALSSDLAYLEKRFDRPFLLHWAFEWSTQRAKLGIGYSRYPGYFGNFSLQRERIFGQFSPFQSELYISAFLRTLSHAVMNWSVPLDTVASIAACWSPVLPGLFEIDPQPRPAWLPELDDRQINGRAVSDLAMELLSREPVCDLRTVLLRVPLDRSYNEFGELEIAAFFASDDFQLDSGQILYGSRSSVWLDRYHFDMMRSSSKERVESGLAGNAISVCSNDFPMIRGHWHDDYHSLHIRLPGQYCFERPTDQTATSFGIDLLMDGKKRGDAIFWHDAWTPLSAPNTATRCGLAVRMDREALAAAARKRGRRLGWFVRLSTMEKPSGEFERRPIDVTAFVDP